MKHPASAFLSLSIRPTTEADLPRVMCIFEEARATMRATGNMHQWVNGYPSQSLIRQDIAAGHSFVCVAPDARIVGTFAFILGPDPTYAHIYDGAWLDDSLPYGVIHRIAASAPLQAHPGSASSPASPHPGSVSASSHGILPAALHFCSLRTPNLRIDTHRDNVIMRHLLPRHGFTYCGIIHLLNGDERLAYQRLLPP